MGIKAGPLRIWLLPKKPLTEKQRLKAEAKKAKKEARRAAKAAKKAAAAKEKEINDSVTVKPKPKLDFDTIVALLRMGSHAIRRFFRSFTVNFFQLHYTVACRDPYDTAIQYGMTCAAAETLPALAGKKIRVLRRDIDGLCAHRSLAAAVPAGASGRGARRGVLEMENKQPSGG